MSNPFYQNWRSYINKYRAESKKQHRSFGEQFFPVFICTSIVMFFIHILSVGAAVAWPAHIAELLTGDFITGLLIGLALIVLLVEVPKYVCIDVFWENYHNDGRRVSWGIGAAALCFLGVSIFLSTYSVDLAMRFFSSNLDLVDIEAIEQKYDSKIKQTLQFWQPQVLAASGAVTQYENDYKKYYPKEDRTRLSTAKSIQRPYKALKQEAKELRQNRDKSLQELQDEKKQAIEEAKKTNISRTNKHENETIQASAVGFWFMLIVEGLYVLIFCFNRYYKNRSENEHNQTATEPIETNQNDTDPKNGAKVRKIDGSDQTGAGSVGANQGEHASEQGENPNKHGQPYFEKGAKVAKVSYRKEDGSYTSYTAAEFLRFAKRDKTSQEKAAEYRQLAQIALNHKRKVS